MDESGSIAQIQYLVKKNEALEKELQMVKTKYNLLKINDDSYKREIQDLKEEVARLWRLHEFLHPYICKTDDCAKREKANFCPHCGQMLINEL